MEGYDAAAKAAILATLAFGVEVVGADVHREGITGVRPDDVAFAARLGYVVKLLAVAELVDGGPDVSVRVHPAMVPNTHPLAAVRGAFNAVFIEGQAAGQLMLYGRGAGGPPSASAVLGDLSTPAGTCVRGRRDRPHARHRRDPAVRRAPVGLLPVLDVADRPGVLAAVATVFGDHGVSIRTMEQVGLGDEARLIFLTHVAVEGDVQATIAELQRPAGRRPGGRGAPGGGATTTGASGMTPGVGRGLIEEYRDFCRSTRTRRWSPCSKAEPRSFPAPRLSERRGATCG